MLNHIRSLLRNSVFKDGNPYEELVAPSFRPQPLRGLTASLHALLFGSDPDAGYLDFRLRQLLTLVGTSDLYLFETALDSRVTYQRARQPAHLSDAIQGTTVTVIPLLGLNVIGTVLSDDGRGKLTATWRVTGTGNSVQVIQDTPDQGSFTAMLTYSGNLSNSVDLGRSGLSIRLTAPGHGFWNLTARAVPDVKLPELLQHVDDYLDDAKRRELFGEPLIEPYLTFHDYFLRSDQSIERLAAVVLALAYRLNSTYNQGS